MRMLQHMEERKCEQRRTAMSLLQIEEPKAKGARPASMSLSPRIVERRERPMPEFKVVAIDSVEPMASFNAKELVLQKRLSLKRREQIDQLSVAAKEEYGRSQRASSAVIERADRVTEETKQTISEVKQFFDKADKAYAEIEYSIRRARVRNLWSQAGLDHENPGQSLKRQMVKRVSQSPKKAHVKDTKDHFQLLAHAHEDKGPTIIVSKVDTNLR